MDKKTVYIETSIPSAYVDDRDHVVSRYQREKTRLWWKNHHSFFHVVSSEAVEVELKRVRFPGQRAALKLLETLPLLPITEEVLGVAKLYAKQLVMPKGEFGDAYHLAVACVHEVDYLLTWNCKHLANANKVEHIQVINMRLGLLTPTILTPEMLIVGE